MAILFLDSSAIAKRYVAERGSQWVRSALDPATGNDAHVSLLAGVEVIAAIARRQRVGHLDATTAAAATAEFWDDWGSLYRHLAVGEGVVGRAMELAERRGLRGYDAVQLATGLILHERCRAIGLGMTFVSADDELNAAASAEGLLVENPNSHP